MTQPINDGAPEDTKDDVQDVTSQFRPEPSPDDDVPAKSTADRKAEKAAKEEADKAAQAEIEGKTADPDDNEVPDEPEENEENEDRELDKEVWGDYGDDEVTTSTLAILQNSGVTPDEAKALLWDAVESGDISKIDRDALVEKVGKAKATLILTGVKANIDSTQEKIAAVKKIATDVAGTEENWQAATKWALKNIPAADLDELRGMLDKGGRSAKVAAQEIVESYNKDPRNSSLKTTKPLSPSGKGKAVVKPLSRREYGQELERAYRRKASPAEFAELRQRREAGKKVGR